MMGCGNNSGNPLGSTDNSPLAKVGSYSLFPSAVEGIGQGLSPKDSLYQLDLYVHQWVQDKLMLQIASDKVAVSAEMERMVEDYRASLLLMEYEKQILSKELNTTVSPSQLADYYADNKEQYQAGLSWVRCYLVKADRSLEGIKDLRKWFKSDKAEDLEKVKLFCAKNKGTYILDENRWTKYEQITAEMPDGSINRRHREGTSVLDRSDDDFVYLLRILEYRDKEDATPLLEVKDEVTQIILHIRSKETLQKNRKKIYEEGKTNNSFEIY